MAATDHNFKVKNGLDVLGGTASISGGHLTLTSNSYGVNTRSVLARDVNGLNLGTSNGTTALSIDNSGNVSMPYNLTVTGNLTVEGSQTVLETTTLSVEDKNITLNYGSGDTSGSANGAGITIQDAVSSSTDATILWDATNDRFDFSHPIQIKSGTAASSPNIFRVLSALESNTNKGDVYAGIELGVTGAENSTGNLTNGVVAAIKAVDFRNGATSYEDSGLGFYTLGASDSSPIFRGGFSNEGGLHISNDGSIDALNAGILQVDGITYANGGLYVSGVQILNTSGSVVAQTFDATDRDFVVTDTNESTTNIIWKDDSEGRLYLGTSTFPAEFRSNINMQTGHAFQMNGTTVIDSSRNAILQGLRASTTESATSSTGINFTATDTVSNQNFTAVRIDHNASGSQTHTGDNAHYALFIDQDSSASGGDTLNEHRLYGIYSDQRNSASGDSDVMYSIYGYSESQHSSGQVSAIHGGFFIGVGDETGTGHTANIYGVLGQAQSNGTGSGGTSNLYGLYGKSLLSVNCDKNTNAATGVYAEVEIDDPGQAQTLAAAYVVRAEYDDDSAGNVTVNTGYMFYANVSGTPATNMYGLYFADDLRHHFKGTLEARGADTDISTALAYGFASDRNTGMYSPENHVLGFANAGTERARLSGGNWLFHKQTDGLDGVGVEFASSGRARFTCDGANVIEINRKTSNGSLVTLYNGGSNLIGQINVTNNLMSLGTGAAGLIFNNTSDAIYPWNVAAGTGSDAALDLGISSRRWRDMHLGRTLYMNGGDIDLRNDTGGDNATIRAVNFKTTGANGTDDRVALISATTSGGTSTTRGGKLRFFTRDPNADSFNEIHVTNAGNLNIVDGGLQTANTQRISNAGALTNISTATLSGAIYSNIGVGGTSMYLDTTTNASSGSVLYGPGIRWRQDDQTSIAGIRGAVSADGTNQLILGTGWLDQEMFIEPSLVRIAGDLQVDGNDVTLSATNKRVKYSVWNNDTYGIGMYNTVTYGGINNDYAMTFQMNNDVDRGWLFLDSDDTLAQGAMALTTEGKLTVADSIRLGYGKNDTTSPGLNSLDLEVSGISKFDSQIRAGSGSEALPAFSFASDTNTGFYRAGENDLAVATAGDTHARFTDDAFQIEGGAGLRLKAGGRSDNPEGTYYNWFQTGAGTDTTSWWKICDVDINTGLYRALAMHIRVKSQYGNYGSTEHVVFSEYTALFPRSGAVQDDAGTPRLSGYDTENHELRIYKTGNGAYELQSRMKVTYRDLIVELQVLSTNGGTVTMNESLSAGTTSGGTAYAATEHTASTAPEFYTGKLVAPSLGIGTTDPAVPLEVLAEATTSTSIAYFSNSNDVEKAVIDLSSNGSGRLYLRDGGNSTNIMLDSQGSSDSYINTGGNFGLGTSSPSAKLHLKDTGDTTLIIEADSDNTGESDNARLELRQDNNNVAGYLYTEGNADQTASGTIANGTVLESKAGGNDVAIQFATGGRAPNQSGGATNGTVRMTILGNGNIGIGNNSPSALLHMYKQSVGSGVTDMLRIEVTRGDHNTIPSGPAILFKDQDSNNLTNEARIKMMTVNDVTYGDNDEAASNLLFETTNGGTASDKMIITGRGDVGIGTVNPTQKLDVVGNIKAGGVSHPELELVPTGSVGNADIRFNGTTFDIRSNSSSADLTLQTNTTERLRITAAGNVGIGEDDSASINDARLVIRDGNYASNQDGGIILQAGDATGSHWRAGFKIKSSSTGSPRTVIETMTGTAGALVEALSFATATGAATFASSIALPLASPLYFGGGSHTYITEDIDDRLRFFTGGTEFMRFTESTTNTLSLYQPVSANNIACTALQASGLITATGASSGRFTGLEVVNSTNAGGTETAIGLGVVNSGNTSCDVKLVANRTGANAGSDFYIEQTDAAGNQQETFRINEAGAITASSTISSGAITSSGAVTGTSFTTTTGARPVNITNGTLTMKGDTGGWAFGLHSLGSSNTDHGGFGFLGSADGFSLYYIGASYDHATNFRFYKSGQLNIGTTTILDSSRNLTNIGSLALSSSITLNNSQKIYFKNSSGTSNSFLYRAGGNATRFEYADNVFIFDSASDTDFEIRNSSDAVVFKVDVGATAGDTSVYSAGNFNAGSIQTAGTTRITSVGNLTNIGTISSGAITSSGHFSLPDSKYVRLGDDNDFIIYHDGASNYIQTVKQDSDLIIRGNDGGTNFNALTIDMSAGGNATFAGTISSGAITASGDIRLNKEGTATVSNQVYASRDLQFLASGWDTNNSVARDVMWKVRNVPTASVYPDYDLQFIESDQGSDYIRFKLHGRGSTNHTDPMSATFYGNVAIEAGTGTSAGDGDLTVADAISGGRFKLGATTIIDGSANLSSIGTISSGVITATGEGHTFYSSSNSIKFGRNANENIQIIVTDGTNKIVATQDSDGNTGHDFILDRVYNASTGSSNFYIQNAGSNQLSIDKNANVTIAGTISSGAITSSDQVTGISLQARNDSGYGTIEVGGSSGAFIDLKKPATDDYDVRIVTDAGTGGRIQSNGVFDIDAVGDITLDADGGDIHLKDNGSSMASFTTGAATFAGTISSGAITSSGTIKNGSYTRILTGASNTGQLTFNANWDGSGYVPDYAGVAAAGMTVLKMPAGGHGGLQVYVKKHGTTSSSQTLGTFTKVAEFHDGGYFDASNGLRVAGSAFVDTSRNITAGTISSGAITANGGGDQSVIKSSSDAPLIVESTDAYSGINFKDTGGNSSMFYQGSSDFLYLHSAKFSVAGSTLATGYQFQVNGSANLTGSLAIGGTEVIAAATRNITAGTISSGAITSSGVTTTLGDSGTNGTINMRATSNFYLQQNGATRLTLNSAGITSSANLYTSTAGEFRNYGGTWRATTGLTGNGFTFSNSVDGTAMTISSTGDVVCTGSLSATTKSFDIEHPTKEGMRLHHGSLEGPEHGVYIRGRNKGAVIELPEYWLGLVDEDTITVQLTAIGEPQSLCVTDIKDNKVYVEGVEYFYFIQAERKDIEKFEVEYAV